MDGALQTWKRHAMPARARTEEGAKRQPSRKLEAELDKALAQTFPASDPVSVGHATSTEPPARPVDRKAPRMETPPTEQPNKSKRRKRA
jgi:hypothetical protein